MYKQNIPTTTTIKVNKSKEGERIETKVNRIVNNKEPIKDGAPIIFTERKEGVLPAFDIRTDRFEEAVKATDLITKSKIANRQSKHKDLGAEAKANMDKENIGGAESSQGT